MFVSLGADEFPFAETKTENQNEGYGAETGIKLGEFDFHKFIVA